MYGQDDNPTLYPATPPCNVNSDSPPAVTMAPGSQANPTATDVSVLPNAFDNPAPRRLELWAATNGASSATFNVFYPNGSLDTSGRGGRGHQLPVLQFAWFPAREHVRGGRP